jgi:hypothetical protein
MECRGSFLPDRFPREGRIELLPIYYVHAPFGGGLGGLEDLRGKPDSEIIWPPNKLGIPTRAYKCDLTNYSQEPVANVELVFHVDFKEMVRQGKQIGSGKTVLSRDWLAKLNKVDSEKSFTFFVQNLSELFLYVTKPTCATLELIGDSKRRVAPITLGPSEPIWLMPVIN